MIHISCQALILDGSPTALSILSYHSPILVFSTKSLPACKYRIGLSTPNTARSAKFGFEPPVQNKTKKKKKTQKNRERDIRSLTSNYARTCAKYDQKKWFHASTYSPLWFSQNFKITIFFIIVVQRQTDRCKGQHRTAKIFHMNISNSTTIISY